MRIMAVLFSFFFLKLNGMEWNEMEEREKEKIKAISVPFHY